MIAGLGVPFVLVLFVNIFSAGASPLIGVLLMAVAAATAVRWVLQLTGNWHGAAAAGVRFAGYAALAAAVVVGAMQAYSDIAAIL